MQVRDSQFSRLLAQRDSMLGREMATGGQSTSGEGPRSREAVALLSARGRAGDGACGRRSRRWTSRACTPALNDAAVAHGRGDDLDGVLRRGDLRSRGRQRSARDQPPHPAHEGGQAARPHQRAVRQHDRVEGSEARARERSMPIRFGTSRVRPCPVVAGVSRAGLDGSARPSHRSAIRTPADTPMEGTGSDVRARTTTTRQDKRIADVLQIDGTRAADRAGVPCSTCTETWSAYLRRRCGRRDGSCTPCGAEARGVSRGLGVGEIRGEA